MLALHRNRGTILTKVALGTTNSGVLVWQPKAGSQPQRGTDLLCVVNGVAAQEP